MRNGESSSVKALLANTGWTLKPSPTQCFGMAGKICFTERRDMAADTVGISRMMRKIIGRNTAIEMRRQGSSECGGDGDAVLMR
jgi:hypothetical protein